MFAILIYTRNGLKHYIYIYNTGDKTHSHVVCAIVGPDALFLLITAQYILIFVPVLFGPWPFG